MTDDIDIVVGKLKRSEVTARPKINRSSYNENSAEMIRPIIDKLLVETKDVFVPCADTGYSAGTPYVKLNDGLLWLMHNDKSERNTDYRYLRTQISMRKLTEGVLIYFKEAIRMVRQKTLDGRTLKIATSDSIKWRHDILTWLQSAQDGEIFSRKDIGITEADKQWVHDTIATHAPDAEVIFTDTSLRMIR